jgi:hypothetical protein
MVEKGTAGMSFVASASRQRRYSRGAEEVRIDVDA